MCCLCHVEFTAAVVKWDIIKLAEVLAVCDPEGLNPEKRTALLAVDPQDAGLLAIPGLDGRRFDGCLLYTSPSPRDLARSRMPSSA